MRKIDHTGKKIGLLNVIGLDETKLGCYWKCECECGNKISTRLFKEKGKYHQVSCGCKKSPPDEKYHERLKKRITDRIRINENGCWEWQLNKDQAGYGMMTYRQSTLRCHRVSWTIYKGKIPEGLYVCHKCDNRICCNPDHLFTGTYHENLNDMLNKNRQTQGEKARHNTKLSKDQIIEIRSKYKKRKTFQKDLAKEYGVSVGQIGKIVRGEAWKDLLI